MILQFKNNQINNDSETLTPNDCQKKYLKFLTDSLHRAALYQGKSGLTKSELDTILKLYVRDYIIGKRS